MFDNELKKTFGPIIRDYLNGKIDLSVLNEEREKAIKLLDVTEYLKEVTARMTKLENRKPKYSKKQLQKIKDRCYREYLRLSKIISDRCDKHYNNAIEKLKEIDTKKAELRLLYSVLDASSKEYRNIQVKLNALSGRAKYFKERCEIYSPKNKVKQIQRMRLSGVYSEFGAACSAAARSECGRLPEYKELRKMRDMLELMMSGKQYLVTPVESAKGYDALMKKMLQVECTEL